MDTNTSLIQFRAELLNQRFSERNYLAMDGLVKIKGIWYAIGYLCPNDSIWMKNVGFKYAIKKETLAIHFTHMVDKNNNKLFASLSKNGNGGDIVTHTVNGSIESNTLVFSNDSIKIGERYFKDTCNISSLNKVFIKKFFFGKQIRNILTVTSTCDIPTFKGVLESQSYNKNSCIKGIKYINDTFYGIGMIFFYDSIIVQGMEANLSVLKDTVTISFKSLKNIPLNDSLPKTLNII